MGRQKQCHRFQTLTNATSFKPWSSSSNTTSLTFPDLEKGNWIMFWENNNLYVIYMLSPPERLWGCQLAFLLTGKWANCCHPMACSKSVLCDGSEQVSSFSSRLVSSCLPKVQCRAFYKCTIVLTAQAQKFLLWPGVMACTCRPGYSGAEAGRSIKPKASLGNIQGPC